MNKNTVHRFREVVKVLAYYGFGYVIENKLNNNKKSPENLRKAFEELGPTFMKIGQILSTRPDMLPDAYIEELCKLQDDAPPVAYEDINETFQNEFNESIDDAFLKFTKKPLASASVAQVHKAVLKDGREVIVKIQRPEIADMMQLDIAILYKILKLAKNKFNDAIIDPFEVLEELRTSTEKELDFSNEADNIMTFRNLNNEVGFLYTPYVVGELSKTKVLTMEYVKGFKISDKERLKEDDYDMNDVGKKLALSYCKQIFQDGFFHGDPHPGNILIWDSKICYIDFGIMGSLSSSMKSALNEMITSVAVKDAEMVIPVLLSIGIKKGPIDRNKLFNDIDYLYDSYLSTSLSNIQISVLLQDVFDAAKNNNLQLPREFTMLIRGLVIIEGVVSSISPEIQILDIAIPFVKMNAKASMFSDISINDALFKLHKFGSDTMKLPSKLIDLTNSLGRGRFKLQLDINNLDETTGELNKMVNRLVFALIICSMIIASSLILNTNIGPKIYNISIIGISGYLIAAVMGFWLLISILRSGKL